MFVSLGMVIVIVFLFYLGWKFMICHEWSVFCETELSFCYIYSVIYQVANIYTWSLYQVANKQMLQTRPKRRVWILCLILGVEVPSQCYSFISQRPYSPWNTYNLIMVKPASKQEPLVIEIVFMYIVAYIYKLTKSRVLTL